MLDTINLKEHVSILDKDIDFLATSSTIDVKNIIANSKDLLRIIYFFDSSYYYIARNTYEETHFSLLNYLYFNKIEDWKVFYVDESKQPYDADCVFIVSTPKDKLQTNLNGESFNIITDDDYNYGYEYENHLILVRRKYEADFCPLFDNAKINLYEEFKDEVSEDTLKKRRKYYLTHGITTSGLLESSKLDVTTPYMLRNDGELLTCGEIHPYIKSSYKEETQKSLYYLFYLHPSFIEWFYVNSLNDELKQNIRKLIYLMDDRYSLGPVIQNISGEEEGKVLSNLEKLKEKIGTEKETKSIKDILDKTWYLTNQEFCRVRTSNYRYKTGEDNGEIYFRISSENFNWFDLIWNTCVKYSPSIDYITIMKDPQVFGKQFEYIKIRGKKINKYPLKEFIELEEEPLIESLLKEEQDSIQREYNEDLNEDIEKHEVLNPLLFDENGELKPDIKEAIIKIVNQFIEDLSADGVKFSLKDIILVGSNVSYNYTKDSDLDIHIIADSESLDCNPEIYTLLYGAYRSLFNKNYDITIKGIPVEIYVELG